MEARTLQAEVRGARGKGSARQLRLQGKVPAVAYGPGLDTMTLAITPKELVKAVTTPWGRNTLLKLVVDGKEHLVLLKDIKVHPVNRSVVHADFYAIAADRPVVVDVPFRPEGKAAGVAKGGVLEIVRRSIPVRVLPEKIPVELTVNIAALEINDTLFVRDVPMPDGVEPALPLERPVVSVHGERKDEEAEAAEAAAAAAAATEGAAGAPAATGSQAPPPPTGDKAAAAPVAAGKGAPGKPGKG